MRFIDVMRSRNGKPVDLSAARAACAERLKDLPVALVYLHGSYAGGSPGALSDVDVAVLLERGLDSEQRLRLQLDLLGILEAVFEDEGIDLAVMNHAGLDFKYQVISRGVPVYVADEALRVEFETGVTDRYLDMRPAREEYFRAFERRILEGGLGARRRTA